MNQNRRLSFHIGVEHTPKTYVLYWMQQAQRVHFNHALEDAIQRANRIHLPVVVFFGLSATYPEANARHFQFMLEGLREVREMLLQKGITFVLRFGSPEISILPLLDQAEALVMDAGYLRHQRAWRQNVLTYVKTNCPHLDVDCIDTDAIVPVNVVSTKAEYGAYTLRPKIMAVYQTYRDFTVITPVVNDTILAIRSDDDLSDIDKVLANLPIDHTVLPSPLYHGGIKVVTNMLHRYIPSLANRYLESDDPALNLTSKLSMYLHFGQISALEILERILNAYESGTLAKEPTEAFVEQLLVRRELAMNYVTYHPGYDEFSNMTEPWAYATMQAHSNDNREYVYTDAELETARTHDPYFNAAMKEMAITGYMHNYMRMYWAKKIIEWTPTHKHAYELILHLNNKYFIDGRDANSYAGVAWCFGKHDRAWGERAVFGKLRYMNAAGLIRKFDIQTYVDRIVALEH